MWESRRGLRTTAVEFERSLESDAFLGGGGFGVRGLGGVESVDVGLVVPFVVELHYLAGDVGLEGIVGVREVGEGVGHGEWDFASPASSDSIYGESSYLILSYLGWLTN